MSKTRQIKDMTDDEFVKFLKSASKNMKQAAQTMERDYQKGIQSIIEFFENR